MVKIPLSGERFACANDFQLLSSMLSAESTMLYKLTKPPTVYKSPSTYRGVLLTQSGSKEDRENFPEIISSFLKSQNTVI